MKVLIVEDRNDKYDDLIKTIDPLLPDEATVRRAATVVAAKKEIKGEQWSLLLLDMSIDIKSEVAKVAHGGHASLGGLDIVEYMYLFELDIPTIIITGFDYFEAAKSDAAMSELVGLDDIAHTAKLKIGCSFLGIVRYQEASWKENLVGLICDWRDR